MCIEVFVYLCSFMSKSIVIKQESNHRSNALADCSHPKCHIAPVFRTCQSSPLFFPCNKYILTGFSVFSKVNWLSQKSKAPFYISSRRFSVLVTGSTEVLKDRVIYILFVAIYCPSVYAYVQKIHIFLIYSRY